MTEKITALTVDAIHHDSGDLEFEVQYLINSNIVHHMCAAILQSGAAAIGQSDDEFCDTVMEKYRDFKKMTSNVRKI